MKRSPAGSPAGRWVRRLHISWEVTHSSYNFPDGSGVASQAAGDLLAANPFVVPALNLRLLNSRELFSTRHAVANMEEMLSA